MQKQIKKQKRNQTTQTHHKHQKPKFVPENCSQMPPPTTTATTTKTPGQELRLDVDADENVRVEEQDCVREQHQENFQTQKMFWDPQRLSDWEK